MNATKLKQLATDMILYCEDSRTCQGCPGDKHLSEFKDSLCNISNHSDNRNQTVEHVLEAVKNNRGNNE